MAHTPGPWQWGTEDDYDEEDLVSLSVEEESLAGEEGGPFPKWLHISTDDLDLGNPDDLVLIAAAPELLAAAEGIAGLLEGLSLADPGDVESYQRLQDAIAEAKGGDA